MFEVGDHVSLGLEPADEVGPVRQLGPNLFDCYIASDRRLRTLVDDREGALSESFHDPVAAQRSTLAADPQGLVTDSNSLFEGDRVRARFEPGVSHRGAVGLEGPQGVGLTVGDEQRLHQLAVKSLPRRMGARRGLERWDDLGGSSVAKVGLVPTLERQ